jgi:hypothetical protein
VTAGYADLVLKRHYNTGEVEILEAPPTALVSLEVLTKADEAAVRVRGDRISVGSPRTAVEYRVVGWEPYLLALVVERQDGDEP